MKIARGTKRNAKRGRQGGHEAHPVSARSPSTSRLRGAPVTRPDAIATVRLGDALEVLRRMPDASADALVTDPPAGIGLHELAWDSDRGGADAWSEWLAAILREAERVLKPGAHGWVWAYPRTSHWTARACELAGLEVRDVASHIFGYRMPKGVDIAKAIDRSLGVAGRVVGTRSAHDLSAGMSARTRGKRTIAITRPTSALARQWEGWATALKPAAEHWILVRKRPRCRTVDAVLEHGTGGLNVGACTVNGRLPSSVIFEHAPMCSAVSCSARCPTGLLGEHARFFYAHRPSEAEREAGCETLPRRAMDGHTDAAGRGNHHASPKPISLMRWLVRLVTPPNGVVLDPFAGSGSTGAAAMLEGKRFLGIEADPAMVRVARARVDYWRRKAGR